MKTYHPHVLRQGRIFQCAYRWWGTGQSLEEKQVNGKSIMIPSSYGRQALTIARHIARVHDRVGIITHKGLEPLFYDDFGDNSVQHFGNVRGTNLLEHHDGLIIFGAFLPPSHAMLDIAAMLDPRRMKPFVARNDEGQFVDPWGPLPTCYELMPEAQEIAERLHGGNVPHRMVGGFRDPDLRTIYEQKCVAELTQAIHRNRILLYPDHVVWVFSPVPLLDTAVDWIADDPPLMPERWMAGQFEKENPVPFHRWLDLEKWGIWEKGREGLTYENIAEGAGVSLNYVRHQKWIDKLAKTYPDLFEVTSVKTQKMGRRPKGLRTF